MEGWGTAFLSFILSFWTIILQDLYNSEDLLLTPMSRKKKITHQLAFCILNCKLGLTCKDLEFFVYFLSLLLLACDKIVLLFKVK
jgi:hypothetical protein